MADRSLYDRLCIRNRIAWYFKLSDTQSLSYFTWTDLETGDMGVYADRVQSDLLTDHGIVLLPAWHGTGTYLGTFRFNVYIFGGMIFTVIGAFVLYGIYYAMNASVISQMPALAAQLSYSIASGFSTNYINMSIFLAFAVMYPDMQVMLYFIIPIKMKWMAIVYAVLTLYEFIVSGWAGRVAIFMSLLNFIIFFFSTRNLNVIRRMKYTGDSSSSPRCVNPDRVPALPSTNVRFVAGQNLMIRI